MRQGVVVCIVSLGLIWVDWDVQAQEQGKQYSYEGTAVCGMCHKSEKQGAQLQVWQESLHAQAYEVLKGEESQRIAKKQGIQGEPWSSPACLRCHATGYEDAARLGRRFKIEDGVQCETCHGPGSDYKTIKVMKDREQAVANGLVIFEDPRELCVQCHNPESPTHTPFKFDEMWKKISHPVPK